MVYLIGSDVLDKPAGIRFRELLDGPGILQLPGTHNGMAALQARNAGFSAAYLSGAAMTASMGLPDLGIITSMRSASSSARWRAPATCRCWSTVTPAMARRSM